MTKLALKIDVDTDRGTREGVPRLVHILQRQGVPATFLFSLGPDNTGKAIRRVFRPGFLKKVTRTNVAGNYGLRTLLNGTLLPAPRIGERNADLMRSVRDAGFEVGIHCWDHFQWQDYLHRMSLDQIRAEFARARETFYEIMGEQARCAGAPGWQCHAQSLQVYDEADLLWGSDTRAQTGDPAVFLARCGEQVFQTLHFSTTLPTLDELMGRPEYPDSAINTHYLSLLAAGGDHVHTLHAEIEGLRYAELFEDLLIRVRDAGVSFISLNQWASSRLADRGQLPILDVRDGEVDGRSGQVALAVINNT